MWADISLEIDVYGSIDESLEVVCESGLTELLSPKKLCMKVNSSSYDWMMSNLMEESLEMVRGVALTTRLVVVEEETWLWRLTFVVILPLM